MGLAGSTTSSPRAAACMSCCCRCNETAISLKAGCQLFLRYTTRTSALDAEDFEAAKRRIIDVRHSCKRAASQCT